MQFAPNPPQGRWTKSHNLHGNFCTGTSLAIGGTGKSIVIGGDFRECWIGIRMGALVEVVGEKYAGNYQYGFQTSIRADVQLAHEAAFCKLTGITP